jgi:hypothetical protein
MLHVNDSFFVILQDPNVLRISGYFCSSFWLSPPSVEQATLETSNGEHPCCVPLKQAVLATCKWKKPASSLSALHIDRLIEDSVSITETNYCMYHPPRRRVNQSSMQPVNAALNNHEGDRRSQHR